MTADRPLSAQRAAVELPPDDGGLGGPIDPPVGGQAVTVDAVIPSLAEQNAAADRARGRTAVQAGVPGALVILAEWGCALADLDLDPWSDGTGLPGTVAGALVALITVALAFRMNPKRTDEL